MLAKLLRISIFTQLLIGAGLGYWLQSAGCVPQWVGVCIALSLPFAVMVLVDTWSGILSRGPEPLSDWFRSLLGEYWAGIVVFILRQPWTTQTPVLLPATGDANRIPVVLIHGYVCNHRIWDDVIPVLRAQGHAVHAVNLEPLYCSIDRYAPIVEAPVQALLAQSSHKQVALVGHSMGGLAIRAWLRVHGNDRAARVLTLGTPHVGTKIADAMPQSAHTPNGKQMIWESDWLKELAEAETDATRTLFRIAITPQDNIVFPQRAQVLRGVEATVFPGIGHVQMCLDTDVINWVAGQLKDVTA
ncbi:MAG: alpha/beta fold hydrolase [Rhodoferax sp.]|nr:alpha/beta fold hydrolase [Rhodoferax sp.]